MNNFLPTLISKIPSVIQETALDSLQVVTGVTQEQLSAAVDAAVESSTEVYIWRYGNAMDVVIRYFSILYASRIHLSRIWYD